MDYTGYQKPVDVAFDHLANEHASRAGSV